MSDLTRIKSGGFDITQCVTLEEVQAAADNDELNTVFRPLKQALQAYPSYSLDESRWQIVSHGGFLDQSINPNHAPIVRLEYVGAVKALYQFDSDVSQYRPYKMFIA